MGAQGGIQSWSSVPKQRVTAKAPSQSQGSEAEVRPDGQYESQRPGIGVEGKSLVTWSEAKAGAQLTQL